MRSAAMMSRFPGSSGASVIRRIGASACSARISGIDAGRTKSGCAPSLPALMYGPSRCTPRTRAAPAERARHAGAIAAIAVSSSGSGAVIVVASSDVVPCRPCRRAMQSIASPPSIVSRPPPPWTWVSMNPGNTSVRASLRASSSLTGVPVMRTIRPPSCSSRPRTKPPCVSTCPSIAPGQLTARASSRRRNRSSRSGNRSGSAPPTAPIPGSRRA